MYNTKNETQCKLWAREENGNPLQCTCLGNSMDKGAWQATVHGVTRVRHDFTYKPPPPHGLNQQ